MIHTGKTLDDQLSSRKLGMILARLDRSDNTWFDGSPGAIDRRLAQVDNALRFARGVTARIGSTEAGRRAADVLPRLEMHRHELVALRDDLLNGPSTRRSESTRTGRRVANKTAAPLAGPSPSGTNWDDVWRNTVQAWPGMHPDHKRDIIQRSIDEGVKRPDWHRAADQRPMASRIASRDFDDALMY